MYTSTIILGQREGSQHSYWLTYMHHTNGAFLGIAAANSLTSKLQTVIAVIALPILPRERVNEVGDLQINYQ
jgi:hypothetical protein